MSAAAEQKLKPGDVILEVGQTEVSSPEEVNKRGRSKEIWPEVNFASDGPSEWNWLRCD